MRTRLVRDQGGVLVRLTEALNGFKTKYGYWPAQVEIPAGTLSALVTHHLTPFGFFLLQSKIEILPNLEEKLVALGREGRDSFDYGTEGWQSEDGHKHDARAWIGLVDDAGDCDQDE